MPSALALLYNRDTIFRESCGVYHLALVIWFSSDLLQCASLLAQQLDRWLWPLIWPFRSYRLVFVRRSPVAICVFLLFSFGSFQLFPRECGELNTALRSRGHESVNRSLFAAHTRQKPPAPRCAQRLDRNGNEGSRCPRECGSGQDNFTRGGSRPFVKRTSSDLKRFLHKSLHKTANGDRSL
jgi:hypothetical protein